MDRALPEEEDYHYDWVWSVCKKEKIRLYSEYYSEEIPKTCLTNLFNDPFDTESRFINVGPQVLEDFFCFLKDDEQIYNLEHFLAVSKILCIKEDRLKKILKRVWRDISTYSSYTDWEMKRFYHICKEELPRFFPSFSVEKLLEKVVEKVAQIKVVKKSF